MRCGMIQFGDWKGNFHNDFEQVKRIEAARSKKFRKAIISIDRKNGRMNAPARTIPDGIFLVNTFMPLRLKWD